jgi:hypothetical protein
MDIVQGGNSNYAGGGTNDENNCGEIHVCCGGDSMLDEDLTESLSIRREVSCCLYGQD